jgi:hypothetical protein
MSIRQIRMVPEGMHPASGGGAAMIVTILQ